MDPNDKVNILLVDDRADNLHALSAMLAAPDRNLVTAASGHEALRRLLDGEYAVVLMDVRMPVMDGFETVALIRQREKTRHLPIVFLTAFGHDEIETRRAYSLGAVDFLLKPVVPEILRSKVEAYIGLYRWIGERTARVEAEKANRAKDEFLATLSHELRAPLNAVLGWVGLLKNSTDPADVKRGIEVIERNARLQARLIGDLLDINRILAGKLKLEFRPVELPATVWSAVESLRPAADAKGIALECDLDPRPAPVTGDAERLQQIVWNLVANALKFVPRGGRVRVGLRREGRQVRLTVADNGPGIAPEFLPHVFERYRQADSSTTRRQGGLGLGLAIVRYLVEMHGGSARCESAGIGKGSTFTVTLPIAGEGNPSAAAPGTGSAAAADPEAGGFPAGNPAAPAAGRLEGVNVLVVDDEPDALDVAAFTLRRCGARVRTVASAAEALAALKAERPDVLISDISMPDEDGISLIRKVRAAEPAGGRPLPAAAMTALAADEDRTRTRAAGFQMHIAKPVEPDAFVNAVSHLAGRR